MNSPCGRLLALLAFAAFPAQADTVAVRDRDGLAKAMQSATAGTHIILAPGDYAGGLRMERRSGTADAPIVLEAADASAPPVIRGGSSGIALSGCSHVELRNLTLENAEQNGLNIDDAGDRSTPARGIVLRGLTVRSNSPKGNRDGIKMSGIDEFLVTGCTVENWGQGGSAVDMVGCHNGTIEKSTFRRTDGDSGARIDANGVQAKGGSSDVAIRDCRFLHAGARGVNLGGHTGDPYFRPDNAGFEARALTVEDCTFEGGAAAIAFVGVDGATVRRNTIRRPERWAFRILQENATERFAPCRNGVVTENRIEFRSDEMAAVVNIGGGTAPDTFRFAQNTWICQDRPADTRRFVKLPVQETDGRYPTESDAR